MADISDYTNVNNFVSGVQSNNRRIYNIPLLFGDELNATYKDILNCEITKKPFRDWRTSEWFFLSKRWWLTMHRNWWWDYVIDYSTFDNAEYAMVRNWDNIEIKKRDWQMKLICTQPFNASVYHSFKKGFLAPHGDVLYSWTVWTCGTTSWACWIKVTSAWWTADAFAWKYLAITTPTSVSDWSRWSIFKIRWNTTDTIDLEFGWDGKPIDWTSEFKVYEWYSETISFIWNDWIYAIINDAVQPAPVVTPAEVTLSVPSLDNPVSAWDTAVEWWKYKNDYSITATSIVLVEITPHEYTFNLSDFSDLWATSGSVTVPYSSVTTPVYNTYHFSTFGTVIDADWNDWRIFAVNTSNTILCSATETNDWQYVMSWWYFAWYMNGSSDLWSAKNVLRVVPFNNVVLLFTNDCIYIVKQVNVERSWTTFNTYNVNIWTDYIGLHSATAVKSYNTWLYLLTSKNSLVSLSIEDWYQWKYKISTEDMWVDIQQWLDNIKPSDKVSLWINNDEIDLSWNNWIITTIFKYNFYYKFWYRWETSLYIHKLYSNIDITYIGNITYRYDSNATTDYYSEWEPINTYDQKLRWMVWEDDIFQLKTILYHKIYLWINTTADTVVHYKFRVSSETYEYEVPLNNMLWLQKWSSLIDNTVLWQSILWYNVLWWNLKNKLVWTLVSDVNVLEIPLWLTFTLAEIWLTWDFECGWHLIWELRHEEQLTPFEDVVPYF